MRVTPTENVNILAASDGGHKDDYGSFGWVIRRTEIGGTARVLREATQCSLTVRKDTAACPLLLFLTHYIRYYDIKPQMTCVSVLLRQRKPSRTEAFHTRKWTRQVGTRSPDHDVIMQLSSVREGLPL
jgi:hypothetical protein